MLVLKMMVVLKGDDADSYSDAKADANIEVDNSQARSVGRGRWHNARKP